MNNIAILITIFISLWVTNTQAKPTDHGKDTVKVKISDTFRVRSSNDNIIEIITNKDKNNDDDFDIRISTSEGIKMNKSNKKKIKKVSVSMMTMDIGLNNFHDQTNYNSAAAQDFIRVDPDIRNSNFMEVKAWQSRNFNMWPILVSYNTSNLNHHKFLITSGIGFQWYNYRFNNSVDIHGGTDPHITQSNINYSKNKLGITYLSVPLLLTGQSKIASDKWLTYGIGVIGGYKIASWTNQKSADLGKVKDKDPFNLAPFQWSLTGEIGVKGILRLYATYQMTNMWNDGLVQQPFAMGIRLFGI